jgi:hypothetical protein
MKNPANVVKTARDERLWREAKASAARQGRARDWPYVMGIFQHMKHRTGSEPVSNPEGKARWQKYGPKGVDWEGEWLVTLPDGRQFRTWRDNELGWFSFVPASDTTTFLPGTPGGVCGGTWGGYTREEAVTAMMRLARNPDCGCYQNPCVCNPDDDDEPWYGSDEARAARLARSAAFQMPELPDYKAIAERVERERLEAEEQERQSRKARELQLRAEVVQQGLFAASSYEAKPKKKKPAPPADTRQVDMFGLPIDEPRKNPGDVYDIAERIKARQEAERARRQERAESVLDSLHSTMMEDPGFQQEVRRQQATQTMQRYAAGPQLFKRGDRVVYAGDDGSVPASWRGRIVSHEWHPEWADDDDGHFYNVRWTTPEGSTHEGVFHQSDLGSAR